MTKEQVYLRKNQIEIQEIKSAIIEIKKKNSLYVKLEMVEEIINEIEDRAK